MKKIIGICGLIGHGKDTAAGFLIEEGFHRIAKTLWPHTPK